MNKHYILSTMLLFSLAFSVNTLNAQNIGINSTGATPDAGAMLDVSASDKGLLIPRVSIPNLASIAPIVGSTTTSMLVYNTNVTTGLGYYYWDGAKWVSLSADATAWKITGNAGTASGTNFLGTTDAQALRIRTNNANRFEFTTDGRLRSFDYGTAALPTYSWDGNSNMGMYRAAADVLAFSTSGAERMRILNGDVLINTTTQSMPQLATTVNFKLLVAATGSNPAVGGYSTGNSSVGMFIIDNASSTYNGVEAQTQGNGSGLRGHSDAAGYGVRGSVVNTVTGWAGLFQGSVGATNGFYNVSDERWKMNIRSINENTSMLDKIMQLKAKKYEWKADEFPGMGFDPELTSYGFIAQDLDKIFPDLVTNKKNLPNPLTNNNELNQPTDNVTGYYMVDYIGLIPVLVEGMQEQQTIIESQNARIEALEKSIQELKDAINKK